MYKILNLRFLHSYVREVAYKLLKNVIFSKEKLFKCNITDNDFCLVCLSATENICHLMLNCPNLVEFNDFKKQFLYNILEQTSTQFINMLNYDILCMFGLLTYNTEINYFFVIMF